MWYSMTEIGKIYALSLSHRSLYSTSAKKVYKFPTHQQYGYANFRKRPTHPEYCNHQHEKLPTVWRYFPTTLYAGFLEILIIHNIHSKVLHSHRPAARGNWAEWLNGTSVRVNPSQSCCLSVICNPRDAVLLLKEDVRGGVIIFTCKWNHTCGDEYLSCHLSVLILTLVDAVVVISCTATRSGEQTRRASVIMHAPEGGQVTNVWNICYKAIRIQIPLSGKVLPSCLAKIITGWFRFWQHNGAKIQDATTENFFLKYTIRNWTAIWIFRIFRESLQCLPEQKSKL